MKPFTTEDTEDTEVTKVSRWRAKALGNGMSKKWEVQWKRRHWLAASCGLDAKAEIAVPMTYKGIALDCTYRADIVVEGSVMLELKAVESILPIHKAQLLTYLKLSRIKVGLLINFHSVHLRDGLCRLVA